MSLTSGWVSVGGLECGIVQDSSEMRSLGGLVIPLALPPPPRPRVVHCREGVRTGVSLGTPTSRRQLGSPTHAVDVLADRAEHSQTHRPIA